MNENNLQAVVEDYLRAFDQRDLDRCMSFFADDATIDFASGIYRRKQAIEEWHKKRFAADLRVKHIEKIKVQNGTVIVDAVASSKVAKAWRFDSIAGTMIFSFQQGKIKEVNFALRTSIPLEGW